MWAKDAEIESLKAALREERADPLPGFREPLFDIRRQSDKRGAPYCKYWEGTIAPAMLNTGLTREHINEASRKPKLNYHPLALAHPPPHTHALSFFCCAPQGKLVGIKIRKRPRSIFCCAPQGKLVGIKIKKRPRPLR